MSDVIYIDFKDKLRAVPTLPKPIDRQRAESIRILKAMFNHNTGIDGAHIDDVVPLPIIEED